MLFIFLSIVHIYLFFKLQVCLFNADNAIHNFKRYLSFLNGTKYINDTKQTTDICVNCRANLMLCVSGIFRKQQTRQPYLENLVSNLVMAVVQTQANVGYKYVYG